MIADCVTSLDTDWDVHGNWLQRLQGALDHVDFLLTNEEEAAELTGKNFTASARKIA